MTIKCPECGAMYPGQNCGHQGLKFAVLRADNLDLINKLEAAGFHNEAAAIRIAQLTAALRRWQWVGRIGHPRLWCPCCHSWKSEGHEPDCRLAAALEGKK